jgi:hypothetical protein
MMRDSHGPENPDTSRGTRSKMQVCERCYGPVSDWRSGTIIVCIAVFGLLRVLQNAEVGARSPSRS